MYENTFLRDFLFGATVPTKMAVMACFEPNKQLEISLGSESATLQFEILWH